MKNKFSNDYLAFAILLAILSSLQSVNAVEFRIQPRLDVGLMYYEFEQEGLFKFTVPDPQNNPTYVVTEGPLSKVSFSDTMPVISGGLTAHANRFFLDVYFQKAFSGEDTATLQKVSVFSNTFQNREIKRKWDREEYAISVGYGVTNNLAVFAGYRQSNSDFDDSTAIYELGSQGFQPPRVVDIDIEYEQSGPFLGAAYQWSINKGGFLNGALTLNLGMAFIEGQVEQTVNGKRDLNIKGDTVGLTTGVSWKSSITDRLKYSLSINGYQYEFDTHNSSKGADFSETVIRTSVGLSYLF